MSFAKKASVAIVLFAVLIGVFLWLKDSADTSFHAGGRSEEEIVHIEFWYSGLNPNEGGWPEYWEGAIARFEAKHTNIRIDYGAFTNMEAFHKLEVGFSTDTSPDLFMQFVGRLAEGVGAGKREPIDRFVSAWEGKDDFVASSLDAGVYEGVSYGIPFHATPNLMMYRKDYFAEAGLDPERPPKTWEELSDYAVRLTKRDGDVVTQAGMDIASNSHILLTTLARQNGGTLVGDDGHPAFESSEWVAALAFLTNLVHYQKVSIVVDVREGSVFSRGGAAITYEGPNRLRGLYDGSLSWFDKVGFFTLERKKRSSWTGYSLMHMSPKSKYKEEAWSFIEFCMSPEEMWRRYDETGCPVLRKSLRDRYLNEKPGLNSAIWDALEVGEGAAKVTWNSLANVHIKKAMERALHENASPAIALSQAKDDFYKDVNLSESGQISLKVSNASAVAPVAEGELPGEATQSSSEETTLRLCVRKQPLGWREYFSAAMARFERENPHIRVEIEEVDIALLRKLQLLRGGVGKDYDLFFVRRMDALIFSNEGQIEVLDPYLSAWGEVDDVVDSAIDAGEFGGVSYGIGMQPKPALGVYRKDLFAKEGIVRAGGVFSWERLARYAKALTKRDRYSVTQAGFSIPSNDHILLTMLAFQNGGRYVDEHGLPDIDSAQWVTALEYLGDLFVKEQVNILVDTNDDKLFEVGIAAIDIMDDMRLKASLLNDSIGRDNVGFFNLKGEKLATVCGFFLLQISKASPNKEQAWDLVKFLMSKEETWRRYEQVGCIVVRKSLRRRFLEEDPERNRAAWKALNNAVSIAGVPWIVDMNNELKQAMEEVFHEDKPASQALIDAKARLLEKLKASGEEVK